jgi:DNA-directed RNA polymerase subunit K/omega
MNSDDEDIVLDTEDVDVDAEIDADANEADVNSDEEENTIEADVEEEEFVDMETNIEIPSEIQVIQPNKRTSKNKMTRYEFVRIIGERIMQLTKGAKPLIKQSKESENFTYKEIALEELKSNMIPFKIRRFVKDHYEIWNIEELNKKHLEPLFY